MSSIRRTITAAVFACLGLLLPAGLASSALAGTQTSTVGDQGGTAFQSACPPGEALLGFGYMAGENLLSISPQCRLLENGTPTGKLDELGSVGVAYGESGAGAVTSTSTACPKGMSVVGMQVYLDPRTSVHHVRLSCHVTDGENKAGALAKQTDTLGGQVGSHSGANCPAGEFATGMIGSYGPVINSLGLICHSADDDTANVATPDTNTGDNETADGDGFPIQLQINLPPLKFDAKPGPSKHTRVALTSTTIYAKPAGKEIAYLGGGDRVTIVTCENNGQGWCKISTPKKGYVWGGDLRP